MHDQIPLLSEIGKLFMGLRDLPCDVSTDRLCCELLNDRRIGMNHVEIKGLIVANRDEALDGAFGVVNAITRYAQTVEVDSYRQDELETFAGSLVQQWNQKPEKFDLFSQKAKLFDGDKYMQFVGAA